MLISEGGNPKNNFLKCSSKKNPSSIGGGGGRGGERGGGGGYKMEWPSNFIIL